MTNTNETKTFSIQDGLKMQANDLQGWKQVLNKKTFDRLNNWLVIENSRLNELCDTGYDVRRGQDLSSFVSKLICEYHNSQIGK